jgi:hypothetical protein
MIYPVLVRRGLFGGEQPLNSVTLDPIVMNSISAYAGSYHILSMGRHFNDYVISAAGPPVFPPCMGLPRAYPFLALSNKLRAAGVTGNIGEGVCGVVADAIFGMPLGAFLHVKLKPAAGLRKTPDYMFRLGPFLRGVWPAVLPALPAALPTWWPVESKARTTRGSVDAAVSSEALPQLASFWYSIRNSFPNAVGFGMTVGFAYEANPRVLINVFLPSNQARLQTYLASKATYDAFRKHIEKYPNRITRCLHDC